MAVTTQKSFLSDREWLQVRQGLGLSPRQSEIVRHLLLGESDKQIAKELQISIPTVRTHLGRLFQKFDLSDRVELILHIFNRVRENDARVSGAGHSTFHSETGNGEEA
ncbi:MAG: LuxR C-terminal-related transcriptional regulator [Sedimentisphaerales bacterium]|jgi:DNA-binding CsgD family transcriptional regulator|nr:LuxR C-terminal-related transcriptional regulator [Planctomycetota bacterium]MDY0357523.1 LuxR C-terminal-related transcriptional regulator [Sedimentisphaerales bacterium]NLT75608.1 response regulator transcription factor [Planctomycetota bacterium]